MSHWRARIPEMPRYQSFEINRLEMVDQTGIALAVGREASDA